MRDIKRQHSVSPFIEQIINHICYRVLYSGGLLAQDSWLTFVSCLGEIKRSYVLIQST